MPRMRQTLLSLAWVCHH